MLALIRPFIPYIIMGVLGIASITGIFFYIRHQGVLAEREAVFKREVESYKAAVERANQIAAGLEGELSRARNRANQLNERLNDEIQSNSVYTSCRVPADGVLLLNGALAGSNAAR